MRKGACVALLALGLSGVASVPGAGEVAARIRTRLEDAVSSPQGVVLLVFFSTECGSCFEDLFEMRYLAERNGWPVQVVGIAAGPRGDLEAFLAKYGWPQPVVWDRRRAVFKKYGVRNAPFKVLQVGGKIVHRDDPYKDHLGRREEVRKCLEGIFSPGRSL